MKIILNNVRDSFKELRLKINSDEEMERKKVVSKMISELKEQTPVDTGFAQNSWNSKHLKNLDIVENTAPYIQFLNQGSSKQAPKFFIERVALKYGKPLGTIVEVVQDKHTQD